VHGVVHAGRLEKALDMGDFYCFEREHSFRLWQQGISGTLLVETYLGKPRRSVCRLG
jgi:hypothetical protein